MLKKVEDQETKQQKIVITAPRFRTANFNIRGDSPLMIAKFTSKAIKKIEQTQRAGRAGKSRRVREERRFEEEFEAARHISTEGWDGIAASAFRNALISVCRVTDFTMVLAKLAVFAVADGYDVEDGTPLVKIQSELGPVMKIIPVRNSGPGGSMDLRARPVWGEWSMNVRIKFDEDILTLSDVTNLLMRVGIQVGVGEGRHFGKLGNGIGFGTFSIVGGDSWTE
jgi:hypothetical protein